MKKINSIFLVIVLVLMSFMVYLPSAKANERTYTEMSFGHWGVSVGEVYGTNVYSLTNKTISSLDGVAISGTVDFSTPGKMLRIGGTDDLKHAGFWFWNGDGILHLSPQGIGGDGFDQAAIHGEVWNSVKGGAFNLRLTFNKVTNGWDVGIYVNGTYFQTLTCPGENSPLTPGLYIGIDPGLNVDMTIPSEPSDSEEKEYKEMTLSYWGKSEGEVFGTNVYSLTEKTITSLDGVAISGVVDFSVPGAKLRIGGTDALKHAGFWFWNGDGLLHISPQGIGGDGFDQAAIHGDVWNRVKDGKFTLRLTFDKVTTGWDVGIYVNGTYFQTLTCPGVHTPLAPGLYIGIDPELKVDLTIPSDETQKEMTEIYSQVKWSGRHELLADGVAMDQAASGFEFKVQAEGKVTVTADVTAETYFTVYIDGVRQEERGRLTPTERTMTIANFATSGEHVIRVVKQTEAQFSQCTLRSLGFDGNLKNKPANSTLYLEFIGDSITCGYGVLTDASNTNAGLPVYEDATYAFPFVTAQLLSAELSVLGCSGVGAATGFREFVAKDYYIANSYYRNANKAYDFAQVPDYVIINLGSNDAPLGATKAQFQKAVKELVEQVRGEKGYNAQVPIIWTDGLMMAHVKEWVTETFTELGGAEAGLHVITFEQDLNGGGTHPTPTGYEAAAKVLADFIEANYVEEKKYTEMQFKDWSVSEGELYGTNIFRLEESTITSLDGVAISGTVNFSEAGSVLRIGGTEAVKHGGFWLMNDGAQVQLSPQGIGGDGLVASAIHGNVWNRVKDEDFTLRLTFDKTEIGWDVGIYIDGDYYQTISCPGVNTVLEPGLYIGIDPAMKVDMDVTVGKDGLPQQKMTELYNAVKWSGRTSLLDYGVALDQAASGVEFTVKTEGKVTFTADVNADTYFTVYVDGVRQEERQLLTTTKRTMTVAEFASNGTHTIRIVKQTEAQKSLCIVRSIGLNGTIADKPADKDMYLEFIGDSITCGFGNLTDAANQDAGNALYEDATLAFPFVTAEKVGADVSVLGFSGMGVSKNFASFLAKDYYSAVSYVRSALVAHDFARVPDYVIVNLGTNDTVMGATKSEFQSAVKALVAQIRGNDGYNTQVPIIWTDGLMGANVQAWVTETFTELGGESAALYVLTFEHDPSGGGAHPAIEGHEAAAKVLADFINANNAEEDEEEKTYTEMKFSDWNRYVGTAEGCMIYGLAEDSGVKSLDGVAISGTVNFSKEGAKLRIGGTENVKHGGFWLWNGDGILHISPQGIGGDTYDAAAVHGDVWNRVKDGEFNLRLTFDQAQSVWEVGVYVDGEYFQTLTCPASNMPLAPGLYVGADSTEVAKGLGGETTSPSDDNFKYKEMTFSDWSKFVTITEGSYIYSLKGHKDVLSLDGIAISGTVNFGGKSGHIRIGGTEELKHAGFWIWCDGESLRLSPQGIGDSPDFWLLSGEDAKAYFDKEFTLRVAFKRNVKLGIWNVKITIDGKEIGTYNCGEVTPGMYLGIDPSVVVDGKKQVDVGGDKEYKEMYFADWNTYLGETKEFDIYSLNSDSTITSLDGVAVSGTVNFGGKKNKKIRIGGTSDNSYSGFWLFNDGESLRLSPQGIGGSGDYWILSGEEWKSYMKKDIQLRLTFDKDKKVGAWYVGIFIDGKEIGSYLCGAAQPGLGLSIDHGIDVEGLGDKLKKMGIDFRLWGYSNKNWRKEMGL